jgi:hypothetical protein
MVAAARLAAGSVLAAAAVGVAAVGRRRRADGFDVAFDGGAVADAAAGASGSGSRRSVVPADLRGRPVSGGLLSCRRGAALDAHGLVGPAARRGHRVRRRLGGHCRGREQPTTHDDHTAQPDDESWDCRIVIGGGGGGECRSVGIDGLGDDGHAQLCGSGSRRAGGDFGGGSGPSSGPSTGAVDLRGTTAATASVDTRGAASAPTAAFVVWRAEQSVRLQLLRCRRLRHQPAKRHLQLFPLHRELRERPRLHGRMQRRDVQHVGRDSRRVLVSPGRGSAGIQRLILAGRSGRRVAAMRARGPVSGSRRCGPAAG